MNVDQLAESLRRDQSFMENVVRWEELPAREARYGDFPPELDARLLPVLRQRGVTRLDVYKRQPRSRRSWRKSKLTCGCSWGVKPWMYAIPPCGWYLTGT